MTKQIRTYFMRVDNYKGWAIKAKGIVGGGIPVNGLMGIGHRYIGPDYFLGHEIILFHTRAKALEHIKQLKSLYKANKSFTFSAVQITLQIEFN